MGSLITRGVALATLLALLVAGPAAAGPTSDAPETRLVGVVNVNTATPEQLELLPGVGPARARAIVEHRKEHGPFKGPADLVAVSGIGDRALARMRPHVATSGKTTARLNP
jgi:competence protein ComEA